MTKKCEVDILNLIRWVAATMQQLAVTVLIKNTTS